MKKSGKTGNKNLYCLENKSFEIMFNFIDGQMKFCSANNSIARYSKHGREMIFDKLIGVPPQQETVIKKDILQHCAEEKTNEVHDRTLKDFFPETMEM